MDITTKCYLTLSIYFLKSWNNIEILPFQSTLTSKFYDHHDT
jgi:hypothetical protein